MDQPEAPLTRVMSQKTTRRKFLIGAAAAGAATAATAYVLTRTPISGAQSAVQPAAAPVMADADILNVALGLEYQAIAAYDAGAKSGKLEAAVLQVAQKIQGQHREHATALMQAIQKLGGTPVQPKASYDFPALNSQADILKYALQLEEGAVSAYFQNAYNLQSRDLTVAAVSIMNDEAQHAAVLRNALGQDPVPTAFLG